MSLLSNSLRPTYVSNPSFTSSFLNCVHIQNSLFLKCIHLSSIFSAKGQEHPFKIKSQKIKERIESIVNELNESNQYDILADYVTPHWRVSYEEELKIKHSFCQNVLATIANKFLPNTRLEIDVEKIISSPVREVYRNKDEFSVWPGLDGNPKTVGYFVGSPAVGKVVCIPPTYLKNLKDSHKEIAQLYQDYIRQSPLPVSYQLYDGGFWRNILVRSNDAGEHMAIVITHPGQYTPELISEQQQLLRNYFAHCAPNLSLFHQSCPHVRCSSEQAPFNRLSGKTHLLETLSDRTFRISPDSFFQVNKLAAERLYQLILEMAKLKHYSTLLDLYCGTGVISILASQLARGCVGIEDVNSAIEDARFNAEVNNVTNCKFISGKVEVKLASAFKNLKLATSIVAVLNPGRAGAVQGVISLLRQNPQVERVIYVSCKPDNPQTTRNFTQLCERVAPDVKPFRLTRAVPVDIFPLTNHCELVLCFERNG